MRGTPAENSHPPAGEGWQMSEPEQETVDATVETAPAPAGVQAQEVGAQEVGAQEVGQVPAEPAERPATSDPAQRDDDDLGTGGYEGGGVGGGVG